MWAEAEQCPGSREPGLSWAALAEPVHGGKGLSLSTQHSLEHC